MNLNFKKYLKSITKATDVEEIELIQSLWSGYGKISRIKLIGSSIDTVVVKNIMLNKVSEHPRGWNTNHSHNRKVKSYKVETNWYKHWNQFCADTCKTPEFIGSYSEAENQWIVLEDLNSGYSLRKEEINLAEIKVCLKWLANFHVTFLNRKPDGLWEIGTYWNLKTRPDEFEKIKHKLLKSKAYLIDDLLNNCEFKTLVHGDAKLANFCFSENGEKVAAVDFQYVGGGCGIKDVAYFLGSCLSGSECERYEQELLDFYFLELKNAFDNSILNLDFEALEKEWRIMYPIACADFTRFLLGWMPSHQKVNNYNLNLMNTVLSSL